MHSHSKSCHKYKNEKCHYNFGKNFTDGTIISVPEKDDLHENIKNNILNEQEKVLSKVKQYIDNNVNRKRSILNLLKEHFEKVLSIKSILEELDITEDEYYNALNVSGDSDFPILSASFILC